MVMGELRRVLLACVLAAVAVLAAVGPAGADTGLKPVLGGLLDRHHQPAKRYQRVVRAWVVDVYWADVQPARGGPIVAGAIDREVAAARTLGLKLKLRVLAGIHAPAWAKSLD